MLTQVKETIKDWNKSDIYAISLWVEDIDDNPCEPTFTLGYNIEMNYQKQILNASGEARWNFAFWLQNEELVFGVDEDTKKIVKDWIIQKGYPYYTYDEIFHTDIDSDPCDGITDEFVNTLIDVVKYLQESGFILKEFGKKIPIIIHELEYYDKIAEQNIKANSLEIIGDDFIDFCRHG